MVKFLRFANAMAVLFVACNPVYADDILPIEARAATAAAASMVAAQPFIEGVKNTVDAGDSPGAAAAGAGAIEAGTMTLESVFWGKDWAWYGPIYFRQKQLIRLRGGLLPNDQQ